jgi:alpha-D-xyloside xylohydrolase
MKCLALVVALAACGDNQPPPFVPLASGPAVLDIVDGALVLSRDSVALVTLPPSAFQIGTVDDLDSGESFDPYWLFVDNAPIEPGGLAWHAASSLRVISSDTQSLTLALDDDVGRVYVVPSTEGSFRMVLSSATPRVAYTRIAPHVSEGERFYGLGEWGDSVEHHGKLRPMQLEVDTSIESSTNEAHVPVPLLLSTHAWGMFVQSKRAGVFDVARMDPTTVDVTFGTLGEDLTVHLFTAPTALELVRPYYDVTGYPGLPAIWAYGPLLWRDENRDQAQVLDDIQQIRTLDLATSGMWFDRPYATGVNTFDWDATKFPAPHTMLDALHAAGLRYAIWHTPYVAPANNDQDPAGEFNAYAMQHGFFPPTKGLIANQWSPPLDFTNPEAYAWWQENLRKYTVDFGVEGFKLDYGEDIVVGASGQRVPWLFADGSDERTMHYGYTMLYHGIYHDALDESGGFLLTRTGRWGDQKRGMIIWPGDLQADLSKFGDPKPGSSQKTVGGLPTAIAFGLSLSASGFPFYASDTGGYRSSPPDNETWLRWVEANAVWPAMQVGDSSSEMPWEFTTANGRNQQSLDAYRKYARLHTRLFPYVWSYATAMAITGLPIARPIGLALPGLDDRSDEWFLGDFVLVAPVIERGATSREVVLPGGPKWLDWWTGAPATATATADLYTLPLYIREGAIVPMLRETIDTLAPTTDNAIESFANDPGILTLRVVAGPQTSFIVFDGSLLSQDNGNVTFMPGSTFTKGLLVELIAHAKPTSVANQGTALTERNTRAALDAATDGWFYDAAATGGTVWIKVAGEAAITLL